MFYDCVKRTKGSMKADDKTARYPREGKCRAIRASRVQLIELAKASTPWLAARRIVGGYLMPCVKPAAPYERVIRPT